MECPNCKGANPPDALFCNACGARLERAPERQLRTMVTLVFTDVAGSTALGEGRDPEVMRSAMNRYFSEMRAIIERHGGTVEKFVGDAVMAVFGLPLTHEDDALRAVRAACDMRDGLARLNAELEAEWGVRINIRTGVNTGEVVAGDSSTRETFATGDTVNTTARLEQSSPAGEILLGETTYDLVRHAVDAVPVEPLTLKGKGSPVPAWRLVGVDSQAATRTVRTDAPLVGRRKDLDHLLALFGRAVDASVTEAVTITGEPGMGKSRLVDEFSRAIPEATVARSGCTAYGETASIAPIVGLIASLLDVEADESPQEIGQRIVDALAHEDSGRAAATVLTSLVGNGSPASTEDVGWALTKLIHALARRRPLVTIVEDIHWASPLVLNTMGHLAAARTPGAILLVATARPGDEQPEPWLLGYRLDLAPLDVDSMRELVQMLLTESVDETATDRLVARSEGNPLYAEELARFLSGTPAGVEVPLSLAGLISSRLDQLSEDEQRTGEAAAVIGEEFRLDHLRALDEDADPLEERLDRLVKHRVVEAAGAHRFRFHHVLYRDVMYQRIAKLTRSRLHERYANLLEADEPRDDELIGVHLELAYRHRVELRPPNDEDRALADRAVVALMTAAEQALLHHEVAGRRRLLERVLALLPEEDPRHPDLRWLLGETLMEDGDIRRARDEVLAARATGERRNDQRLLLRTDVTLATLDVAAGAIGLSELRDRVEAAIAPAERFGDDELLLVAWVALADGAAAQCRLRDSVECGRRASQHERRLGRDPMGTRTEVYQRFAQEFDDTPLEVILRDAEAILADVDAPTGVRGDALLERAIVAAYLGDAEAAEAALEEWRLIVVDLGIGNRLFLHAQMAGWIRLMLDDLDGAEVVLSGADRKLESIGEHAGRASVNVWLARTYLRQGGVRDAERCVGIARDLAVHDDVHVQAVWRGVAARIAARRGDVGTAERLVREALVVIDGIDHIPLAAEIILDHAAVLDALGKPGAAKAELDRAFHLMASKGAMLRSDGYELVTVPQSGTIAG